MNASIHSADQPAINSGATATRSVKAAITRVQKAVLLAWKTRSAMKMASAFARITG